MTESVVHIAAYYGISAAGSSLDEAVNNLYSGTQAFAVPGHFQAHAIPHGLCSGITVPDGQSRAEAILEKLLENLPPLPDGTFLYLATTVGAVDLLEQYGPDAPEGTGWLLRKAVEKTGLTHAVLVAAACASGQSALSMAAMALRSGRCQNALVIGLDCVSEFVTSGFSSLGAVSGSVPRPYDRGRDGLLLGEGAGFVLLTTDETKSAGRLAACGESCDAAHITAPDLTGAQMANAIRQALARAGLDTSGIGGVIGHGTGTVYNDQAELAALSSVWPQGAKCPLVSIKGCTGHTLGATGILQIVYGLEFLKRKTMPPQAGLQNPADGAEGWVSADIQTIAVPRLLSLNAGFGGLNCAVIIEGGNV